MFWFLSLPSRTWYQFGINALVIMVGRHHHGLNVEVPLAYKRDLHYVEVAKLRRQVQQLQQYLQRYELRRQVQQLQEHLEHYKPFEQNDSHYNSKYDSSNDEVNDVNSFHHTWSQTSSEDDFHHHHVQRDYEFQRDLLNAKVNTLNVEEITIEASNLWDLYYGAPIYDNYFDEAITTSFSLDHKSIKTQQRYDFINNASNSGTALRMHQVTFLQA